MAYTKPCFKEACDFWIQQTLDFSIHPDGYAGFKSYSPDAGGKYTNSYGLLWNKWNYWYFSLPLEILAGITASCLMIKYIIKLFLCLLRAPLQSLNLANDFSANRQTCLGRNLFILTQILERTVKRDDLSTKKENWSCPLPNTGCAAVADVPPMVHWR
ncbi:hypothetical protein CS542_06865 [Pedobacter sp. IW39]|nr:hypothetical protein CS542_06865 [Pedobacter sp. IW39]